MTKRERPQGVPEAAQFIEAWDEWALGERDASGREQGLWKSWRKDGSYSEEAYFRDGKLHGDKRRFFEDGALSLDERNEDGHTTTRRMFRPKAETKEPHPFGNLSQQIATVEFEYEDDWFVAQRLLTADGTEVAHDGAVAPPRPPGVGARAVFLSRPATRNVMMTATSGRHGKVTSSETVHEAHRYWELGTWNFVDGKKVCRGVMYQYDVDGSLEAVTYGAPDHEMTSVGNVGDKGGSGNPLIHAARANDAASVDKLWAIGLWQSPNAALHAALAGQPTLAQRIRAALAAGDVAPPALADPRADKPRPGRVPDDAAWVPGHGGYVRATLDAEGRIVGHADVWESPYGYTFVIKHDYDFVDGRVAVHSRNNRESVHETTYVTDGPRAGQVRVLREFDVEAGARTLTRETEYHDDGSSTERVFVAGNTGERTSKDGAFVRERWLDARGAVCATVEPLAEQPAGAEEPLERFTGLRAGVAVLAGTTEAGLKGEPHGPFTLLDGGEPAGEVDFERISTSLTGVKKHQLVDFATKLARWIAIVDRDPPALLRDIVAIDWTKREGWFSDGSAGAMFVVGLTLDDDAVFEHSLYGLWDDVLHQETISALGGPVLDACLRILPTLSGERQEKLLRFVTAAVQECGMYFRDVAGAGDRNLAQLYVAARPQIEALASARGAGAAIRDLVTAFLEASVEPDDDEDDDDDDDEDDEDDEDDDEDEDEGDEEDDEEDDDEEDDDDEDDDD